MDKAKEDELDRLSNSKSTAERLRGMSQQIAGQLAVARQQHVVTINTIASEAVDIMQEYIKALEAHVRDLEAELVKLRESKSSWSEPLPPTTMGV